MFYNLLRTWASSLITVRQYLRNLEDLKVTHTTYKLCYGIYHLTYILCKSKRVSGRKRDRCQVGSDGCSPHRMLLGNPTLPGWQGWMLAPSNASRKPDRCQVGSDGCSPHRMLLGNPIAARLAAMDARPIECF